MYIFENFSNHADRRGTDQIKTEFKFLQEADTRVGLIVDTENTAFNDILDRFIRKLEPNSQVLILDRAEEQKNGNWKTAKELETDGVVTWSRQGPLRLKSMVDFFLSKLDMVPGDEAVSSELIIVTAGSVLDNENDVNTMVVNMHKKNVVPVVVVYPYDGEAKTNITMLSKLVSQAKGTLQLVARDDEQLATNSQLALDKAFDSLPDDGHAIQHVLIASEKISGTQTTAKFEFIVDESLMRDGVRLVARFVPTSSSRDLLSPSYELISPERSFSTKSSEYKKKLGGSGGFEVPLNERFVRQGKWNLQLARPANNNETLVGLAYAVVPRKLKPIKARCWLNTNRAAVASNTAAAGGAQQPLTLFVSLTEDYNKLVQKAIVEVTLTDDRGQPLKNTPTTTMSDDGLGRPDITSGDGIYSQLLLDVTQPGYYGARVTVRGIDGQTKLHHGLRSSDGSSAVSRYNNPLTACCGSTVPDANGKISYVYNLQRELDCGFFHFDGHFDKSNYLAPINDLRVRSVDTATDRRTVTVAWTDPGTVAHYEYKLFRSNERREIRGRFDQIGHAIDELTFSGIQPDIHATLNVTLPEAGIYYLAIKLTAMGDKQLSSVSNVINFVMSADPSVTTTEGNRKKLNIPADGTYDPSYADSDDILHFSTDHSRSGIAGLQTWHIAVITAASLILLVLFIACLICICACRKRKDDKDSESAHFGSSGKHGLDTGMSNLTIQTTMGASNSNLVSEKVGTLTGGIGNISSTISEHNLNMNRAASVNGGALAAHNVNSNTHSDMNVNHMSPIQSWPADVLLDHYDRVQKARERNEVPPVMRAEDLPVSGSGSCSTDSNQSRESVSYVDENAFVGGMANSQRDWRYENLATSHTAVPYHPGVGGASGQLTNTGMYADQYGYEVNQDLNQISWRDSYVAPTRIETPSDYHYNAVPRRTNAVSQV